MNSPLKYQNPSFIVEDESYQNPSVLEFVQNTQSEILYFKSVLGKAEQLIQYYKQENKLLKKENEDLLEKCRATQHKLKQLMKNLIKQEESTHRQIQMATNLEQLKNKLTHYQNTIQILEGKLLILNVAIRKQEYATKCKQLTSNLSHLEKRMKHQKQRNAQKEKQKFQTKNLNYITPRIKKRATVSTYESSATRLTDLRRKNYDIINSRMQTQGAMQSDTNSHKFFLDCLQQNR